MPELMLAQNIRRLRLKAEMTQEELAEPLGVTGQAVSRWERGECYPDIALLPGLANLFDVTLDELMGMEELRDRKNLYDVHARVSVLGGQGKYLEAAQLLEQALKIYPDDYGLMAGVGQYLVMAEGTKHIHRAISMCEAMLQNSKNVKHCGTVRASLCWMYRMAGEPEKAYSLARNLQHCKESRELLWPQFMDPPEREAYVNKHLPVLLAQIQSLMDGKTMTDEEGMRWTGC